MKHKPTEERHLTAAPHDRPRHIDDPDDEPDQPDICDLPLDEMIRRLGWR